MNINRDNYESWFMDYLEGRLNAAEEKVLMSFLEFNPDLEEEFRGVENIHLEPEEVSFNMKSTLRKLQSTPKRQMILDNFEDYCIAGMENQLSVQEEELLLEVLNEDLKRMSIYMLYHSTRIVADPNIQYPYKQNLKKRSIQSPRVRIMISSAAAAALILLAISLFFRNPGERTEISQDPVIPIQQNSQQDQSGENLEQGSDDTQIGSEIMSAETNTPVVADYKSPQKNQRIVSQSEDKSQIPATEKDPAWELVFIAMVESRPAMDLEGCTIHPIIVREYTLNELGVSEDRRMEGLKSAVWKLADAGINKINEISEEDYSLERKTDQGGRARRFTFETPLFGISAPLRKPDSPR